MIVTVLEKNGGLSWSEKEVAALTTRAHVEVERLGRRKERLVCLNKPLRGSFQEALGNSDFTAREVDYVDRWA